MILLLLNRIHTFFIPAKYAMNEVTLKRTRMFMNVSLIISLFTCFYVGVTRIYGLTNPMHTVSTYSSLFLLIVWLLRYGSSLGVCVTLYTTTACIYCLFEIYYGDELNSLALLWMTIMPVVSLLMNNTNKSVVWFFTALLAIVTIGILSILGYVFLQEVKTENRSSFIVNSYGGVVIIIFFIALVLESGQKVALKKLNEQNILLTEDKKKIALYDVSQELHDNVGQTLTLVKVNLHTALLLKDENTVHEKLNNALELLTKVIIDVRELSHSMNMENITQFNIVDAIKSQVEAISKIGIYVTDFCVSGNYHKLNAETELILFRIVQETINNIIKHSQAKSIQIKVHYNENYIYLAIKDDGIGINTEKFLTNGQGIRIMRSRAALIGGVLEIRSKADEGTTINLNVPLHK